MKYWVHVISKDHALTGVEAGFIWAKPADHALTGVEAGFIWAKPADLQLLRKGDLVFFSSKELGRSPAGARVG